LIPKQISPGFSKFGISIIITGCLMFIEKLAPFGGRTFLGSRISMASSPPAWGWVFGPILEGQLGRRMS